MHTSQHANPADTSMSIISASALYFAAALLAVGHLMERKGKNRQEVSSSVENNNADEKADVNTDEGDKKKETDNAAIGHDVEAFHKAVA